MKNVTFRRGGVRLARAAAFGLLAVVMTLCATDEASAQWTQPDAAGIISNMNTGNVGIGTAAPNQRLGVQGSFGLYPQAWTASSVRGMCMYHGGGGG